MANSERKIKKDFWTDEKISKICIEARLLYIGLWSMADDYGVLRGATILIKNRVFPYDEISVSQVDTWLDELIDIERLEPFTSNGESFLYIKNFLRHQGVLKKRKTDMPQAPNLSRVNKSSRKKVKKEEKKEEKKTLKRSKKKLPKPVKSILEPIKEPVAPFSATVDEIYNYYLSKIQPRGGGKREENDAKNWIRIALINYESFDLKASIENYLKKIGGIIPQFRRTCGNFFSTNSKYYIGYLPQNYMKKRPKNKPVRKIIRDVKPKDPFKKDQL